MALHRRVSAPNPVDGACVKAALGLLIGYETLSAAAASSTYHVRNPLRKSFTTEIELPAVRRASSRSPQVALFATGGTRHVPRCFCTTAKSSPDEAQLRDGGWAGLNAPQDLLDFASRTFMHRPFELGEVSERISLAIG